MATTARMAAKPAVLLMLLGMGSFVAFRMSLTRGSLSLGTPPSSSATSGQSEPRRPSQRLLAETPGACPEWARPDWEMPPLPNFTETILMERAYMWATPEHVENGTARVAATLVRLQKVTRAFDRFLEELAAVGSSTSLRSACSTACAESVEACKLQHDIAILNSYPNSGTTWTGLLYEAAVGLCKDYGGNWRSPFRNLWRVPPLAHKPKPCGVGGKANNVTGVALSGNEVSMMQSHSPHWNFGVRNTRSSHKPSGATVARVVHLKRNVLDNVRSNFRHYFGQTHRKFVAPLSSATYPEIAFKFVHHYVRWHCKSLMETPFIPTLIVSYDDALENPEREFDRMLRFVGNSFTAKRLSDALSAGWSSAKKRPQLPFGIPASVTEGFWTESILDEIVRFFEAEVQEVIASPSVCFHGIIAAFKGFHVAA